MNTMYIIETTYPVSHVTAMDMLGWLEHQPEATPYNTSMLTFLKELAAQKILSSLKQMAITSFYT